MSDAPAARAKLDRAALAALGDALYHEILGVLGAAERFSEFDLQDAHTPPVLRTRVGEQVAWATEAGVEVSTAVGSSLSPAVAHVGVHMAFDGDPAGDMEPDARADVVAAAAEHLAGATWDRLDGLFATCSSSGRAAGTGAIAESYGPGPVRSGTLANGVDVVWHPGALVFALLGSSHKQYLVEDNDTEPRWHLQVRLEFVAALRSAGARRLYAQGPGPA